MHYSYGLSYFPRGYEYLDAWSDYGFCLAHLALDDPEYAAYYRRLGETRPVFLDNGFFELGEPLSVPELLRAAQIVRPSTLCAPDWIDDPMRTLHATKQVREALHGSRIHTGMCVTGSTPEAMLQCYESLPCEQFTRDVVICLPFKCPRVAFLKLLPSYPRHYIGVHWHLLGFHNVPELLLCGEELRRLNVETVTFDTSKLLNYAYQNLNFDPLLSESGRAKRPARDLRKTGEALVGRTYITNYLKMQRALGQLSPTT